MWYKTYPQLITMRRVASLHGLVMLVSCIDVVDTHGRLIEPPSRASMWRYGYDSPPDYHDNQLWCGGFMVSLDSVFVMSLVWPPVTCCFVISFDIML